MDALQVFRCLERSTAQTASLHNHGEYLTTGRLV